MGRVGAGATIEPEHEQVPPGDLGEVEFPISDFQN
jgi:repressor LexA